MGADGYIIMVKIEDIKNIINRFFLEAYIRKNIKKDYDDFDYEISSSSLSYFYAKITSCISISFSF